uniref:SAM domain-containing protein n=1 Tax=Culex tarsalis TaxID=7177 RepID=A0A1Q3EV56_CULTA
MFHQRVPTPTETSAMVSPKIFKFSPESLAAVDVSFESYKQQSKPQKRSFTPIANERNMRSPNISPIPISNRPAKTTTTTTIRMTPRHVNTPRPKDIKRPMVPKLLVDNSKLSTSMKDHQRNQSMITLSTPLAKRKREHRITVPKILRDLDLARYIDVFVREKIDFVLFLTLNEDDLQTIGIDCQRDIELILSKVAELNSCL